MSDEKIPTDPKKSTNMSAFGPIDRSAILTIIGVILLFSMSVLVTLIAPRYVDSSWTSPSSSYQVQMYEVEDPNLYISHVETHGEELHYARHLKQGFTLMSFEENKDLRIVAPKDLEHFITALDATELKLTSRLLLLREPQDTLKIRADQIVLDQNAKNLSVNTKDKNAKKNSFLVLELYDPKVEETIAVDLHAGIIPNWIDEKFKIIDEQVQQPYHTEKGVVYVKNPMEYRVRTISDQGKEISVYDPKGKAIKSVEELKKPELGFHSRQELIAMGEQIYAIEGCWYCHTDQTRTLIQDTVSNGADAYPAPPSSANEYIYQKITFPGTRRIGPDISRTAVRRPSREWHIVHFWAPKTAVIGTVMPAFKHFFHSDNEGKKNDTIGHPTIQFEAIYQYMMTKGSRITPPTQAWWLGKDPVKTIEIIQGVREHD